MKCAINILQLNLSVLLICIVGFFSDLTLSANEDSNESNDFEVIRIVQPGIFDLQTESMLVRIRAWGVAFPDRGQPGYDDALGFTERNLIATRPQILIKTEFDVNNLKLAEVILLDGEFNFSKEAISLGVGWHLENETGRYGPYLLSQMKAKRMNLGIWSKDFIYDKEIGSVLAPIPKFPNMLRNNTGFTPKLSFWVTSLGRIHRPGCPFYERGRGKLTTSPTGSDCRICGGRSAK